ncbi:MAG: hypothetical protein HYV13_00460 [Candidatus Doudnabacteria bacterium]|nr:hypothetical protein [Candidatus Doudnabacteria bacterium]
MEFGEVDSAIKAKYAKKRAGGGEAVPPGATAAEAPPGDAVSSAAAPPRKESGIVVALRRAQENAAKRPSPEPKKESGMATALKRVRGAGESVRERMRRRRTEAGPKTPEPEPTATEAATDEERLAALRKKYVKAQKRLESVSGIKGTLKGLSKASRETVEKESLEAHDEYLKARAEVVGESLAMHTREQLELQAEYMRQYFPERLREKGENMLVNGVNAVWNKYNALGQYNLARMTGEFKTEKTFKEAFKSKDYKTLAKHSVNAALKGVSFKTAASLSLLGFGSAVGAASVVGASAFAIRGGLVGAGSSVFAYGATEGVREYLYRKELSRKDIAVLTEDEVNSEITRMVAKGAIAGKDIDDLRSDVEFDALLRRRIAIEADLKARTRASPDTWKVFVAAQTLNEGKLITKHFKKERSAKLASKAFSIGVGALFGGTAAKVSELFSTEGVMPVAHAEGAAAATETLPPVPRPPALEVPPGIRPIPPPGGPLSGPGVVEGSGVPGFINEDNPFNYPEAKNPLSVDFTGTAKPKTAFSNLFEAKGIPKPPAIEHAEAAPTPSAPSADTANTAAPGAPSTAAAESIPPAPGATGTEIFQVSSKGFDIDLAEQMNNNPKMLAWFQEHYGSQSSMADANSPEKLARRFMLKVEAMHPGEDFDRILKGGFQVNTETGETVVLTDTEHLAFMPKASEAAEAAKTEPSLVDESKFPNQPTREIYDVYDIEGKPEVPFGRAFENVFETKLGAVAPAEVVSEAPTAETPAAPTPAAPPEAPPTAADMSDADIDEAPASARHLAALAQEKTSAGLRVEVGRDYGNFMKTYLGISTGELDKVGALTVSEFTQYASQHAEFADKYKGLLDWTAHANRVDGNQTVHDMLINTAADGQTAASIDAAKEAAETAAQAEAEAAEAAKQAALEKADLGKATALVEQGKLGDGLHVLLKDKYNAFMRDELGTSARALNNYREMTLEDFMDEYAKNEKLWQPLGKFKRIVTEFTTDQPRLKDAKLKDFVFQAAIQWKKLN